MNSPYMQIIINKLQIISLQQSAVGCMFVMYGIGKIFYSQFEGDVSDIVYPNILLSRVELFLRVLTFNRPYD